MYGSFYYLPSFQKYFVRQKNVSSWNILKVDYDEGIYRTEQQEEPWAVDDDDDEQDKAPHPRCEKEEIASEQIELIGWNLNNKLIG